MPMTRSNAKPGSFDVARLPGPFGDAPKPDREPAGLREGDALGDLTLERRLGEGGAGEVWLARNQFTGRAFAVKACSAPGSRSLLANEARALGRLMDAAREKGFPDSIVRLLETQLASEPPYLVMEFVEGGDLRRRLRDEGPLSEKEAGAMLRRVLEALQYAHGLGLAHRDIKPENILLDGDGRARVTDFGLGQVTVANTLSIQRSVGGASAVGSPDIGGTVDYMAPELLRGEPSTPASDLYSVGIVLFEALTGERPRGLTKPTRRREGLRPAWDDLFERCYAHDPSDRFQSAEECLSAADRLLSDLEGRSRPVVADSDHGFNPPKPRGLRGKLGLRANARSDEQRLAHLAREMDADAKLRAYFGYRFFGWILPAVLWSYVAHYAYHQTTTRLAPPLAPGEAEFARYAVMGTAWALSWLLFQSMARWSAWKGRTARGALTIATLAATGVGLLALIHLLMYAGMVATLLALGMHVVFLGDARAKLLGRRGLFHKGSAAEYEQAA